MVHATSDCERRTRVEKRIIVFILLFKKNKTRINMQTGYVCLTCSIHTPHHPRILEEGAEKKKAWLNDSSTDEIATSNPPFLKELHWNDWERGGQDERKTGALCIVQPSQGVFGLLSEVTLTVLGIKEQSIVHGPQTAGIRLNMLTLVSGSFT